MTLDLSYLLTEPSEDEKKAIQSAVAEQCLIAISTYLTEVADTMEANNIAALNTDTLRAMAAELNKRLEDDKN